MLLLDTNNVISIDDYNSFTFLTSNSLDVNKRYVLQLYNHNHHCKISSNAIFPKNKQIIIFENLFIPVIGTYNIYINEYLNESIIVPSTPTQVEIVKRTINEINIEVYVKNSGSEIKMEKQNYSTKNNYKFEFKSNNFFHLYEEYILYTINEINNQVYKFTSMPTNKSLIIFEVVFEKFGEYSIKLFNKNNLNENFHLQFDNNINTKCDSKIIHFEYD
jgi:hypothetical protein